MAKPKLYSCGNCSKYVPVGNFCVKCGTRQWKPDGPLSRERSEYYASELRKLGYSGDLGRGAKEAILKTDEPLPFGGKVRRLLQQEKLEIMEAEEALK